MSTKKRKKILRPRPKIIVSLRISPETADYIDYAAGSEGILRSVVMLECLEYGLARCYPGLGRKKTKRVRK